MFDSNYYSKFDMFRMDIRLFVLLIVLFTLFSCISVFCDSRTSLYVVNSTEDTVLIGSSAYAEYNVIDSVIGFLHRNFWSGEQTTFNGKGRLNIGNMNIIMPDSIGCYNRSANCYGPRLGGDNARKGYFFVIKLKIAENNSWEEICRYKLYDTLVVTREMLGPENLVEYRGN